MNRVLAWVQRTWSKLAPISGRLAVDLAAVAITLVGAYFIAVWEVGRSINAGTIVQRTTMAQDLRIHLSSSAGRIMNARGRTEIAMTKCASQMPTNPASWCQNTQRTDHQHNKGQRRPEDKISFSEWKAAMEEVEFERAYMYHAIEEYLAEVRILNQHSPSTPEVVELEARHAKFLADTLMTLATAYCPTKKGQPLAKLLRCDRELEHAARLAEDYGLVVTCRMPSGGIDG